MNDPNDLIRGGQGRDADEVAESGLAFGLAIGMILGGIAVALFAHALASGVVPGAR